MKYNLDLNERAFKAIINQTKRVEIRTITDNTDYSEMSKGDVIVFNNGKNEKIVCGVTEVNHYKTVEELITLEGTRYTTSSTNDYNEAVKNINKLTDYQEAVKKYGIYAIHIEYLYKEDKIWLELLNQAKEVQKLRKISDNIDIGGGAAILSNNGNTYTGVCINTACSIGMCAERNALLTMITNRESQIEKVVCVGVNSNIIPPCEACMELMMQLNQKNSNTKILQNIFRAVYFGIISISIIITRQDPHKIYCGEETQTFDFLHLGHTYLISVRFSVVLVYL